MVDDGWGVPGEMLGPLEECLVYPTEEVRAIEMELFWVWVAGFFRSFEGAYDDVPSAFREDGSESLMAN